MRDFRVFVFALLLVVAASAYQHQCCADDTTNDGMTLFHEKCMACHTIGAGRKAAPDLIRCQSMNPDPLSDKVANMGIKAGGLLPEEVSSLVSFIKDPEARDKLIAAGYETTEPVRQVGVSGPNLSGGKELFFGQTPFRNGGESCSACHAMGGEGGTKAPDLTDIRLHKRADRIFEMLVRSDNKKMQSAYADHPLTPTERALLLRYLETAH